MREEVVTFFEEIVRVAGQVRLNRRPVGDYIEALWRGYVLSEMYGLRGERATIRDEMVSLKEYLDEFDLGLIINDYDRCLNAKSMIDIAKMVWFFRDKQLSINQKIKYDRKVKQLKRYFNKIKKNDDIVMGNIDLYEIADIVVLLELSGSEIQDLEYWKNVCLREPKVAYKFTGKIGQMNHYMDIIRNYRMWLHVR